MASRSRWRDRRCAMSTKAPMAVCSGAVLLAGLARPRRDWLGRRRRLLRLRAHRPRVRLGLVHRQSEHPTEQLALLAPQIGPIDDPAARVAQVLGALPASPRVEEEHFFFDRIVN